jgi:hypothetical protein
VIAGRVSRELHEQIKEAAKKSGRSMSEELAWRAQSSFEWEKAFGTVTKMLNDNARMLEDNIRAALRTHGWTPVRDLTGTFWLEPGTQVPVKAPVPDEIKDAITDAVRQALAETKEKAQ